MEFSKEQQELINTLVTRLTNEVIAASGRVKLTEIVKQHTAEIAEVAMLYGYSNATIEKNIK